MSAFWRYTCSAMLGLLVTAANALAQPVTFTDQTFDDADWEAEIIRALGGTGTFQAGQRQFGGNPGEFRRTEIEGQSGEIHVGHLNSNAIYRPQAQGEIMSISYSYDVTNSGNVSLAGPVTDNGDVERGRGVDGRRGRSRRRAGNGGEKREMSHVWLPRQGRYQDRASVGPRHRSGPSP